MNTAIFNSDNKSSIKLLVDVAKKMGIKACILST